MDTWINIIAAFALVNMIWVIFQATGHQFYFKLGSETREGVYIGLPGIMGQRVFQGILCAVATPILLKKSLWFTPLIIAGLYFSKSSTAIAAALAGALFLFHIRYKYLIPFILIGLFFIAKDVNFEQFKITVYSQTLPLIENHWLGQGLGAFHQAHVVEDNAKMWFREAHNEYYQLYFEYGRIGVAFLLWLFSEMAFRFFRHRKDKTIQILSACFLAFLISCSGQPVMHVVRIAMVGVVLTALIYARSDQLKGEIQ